MTTTEECLNDNHDAGCTCDEGRAPAKVHSKSDDRQKLYFETAKSDEGVVEHFWELRSSKDKMIGSSHFTYKSKDSAINNCVAVMGRGILDETRVALKDGIETRAKIVDACRAMFGSEAISN